MVFTIAAWNYPYLIAVNSVVPALMAGNAVILKHSAQTPLCAERFAECFEAAGLPIGVFQIVHASHEDTDRIIRDPRINFVAFTGSVAGGHAVQRAASSRFIGVGLELGGCDPVYVRHDANLAHAIENIVDGAYFNSGQSCCGLQRIYVHHGVYQKFVDGFADLTRQYVLDDPRVMRRLHFFKLIYAAGGLMMLPRLLADLANRRRQARYAFSGGNTPVDPA